MKSGTSNASTKGARNNSDKKNNQASSSDIATGLRELFEDQLKDIYWAEKALTKALPKMAKKATSEELIAAITEHISVTEEQVTRLEEVFDLLGKKAQAKKCEAMDGLITEATEIMENTESGVVRDAGIIAASQKVEHYEIASYGTLCAFAKVLGEDDVAALLEETLNEEKEADMKLTEVAESSINVEAANADDDIEEDEEEDSEEQKEKTSAATKTKSKRK